MMQNKLLNLIPHCMKCEMPLQLTLSKSKENHDGRHYKCLHCSCTKSLRYDSFAEEFKCTLMELCRLLFYYFCRGYTIDSVHKEMTHYQQTSKTHQKNNKQMILGIYAFAREMISTRVIKELKDKKLGGVGVNVWLDTYKLNMRTNSGVEEFWIVGII
jgi:hypothetical protein